MKRFFITSIFLFFISAVSAQSETEKAYFAGEVKDTFKNSSVVLLRSFEEYEFKPYGMYDYKINYVFRNQYKLNDIAAINSFSTMSKQEKLKRFEIRQIKPNGKVKVIYEYFDKNYPDNGYEEKDSDEEDGEEDTEPEQIPMEDLEVGDIIDYKYEFTYTTKPEESLKVKLSSGYVVKETSKLPNFNKFRYLATDQVYLNRNLPLASRLMVFKVPDDLKMIQKSFNTNIAFTESKKSSDLIYQLKYELMPEYQSEDYSFASKYCPYVSYAFQQTDASKKPYYVFNFNEAGPSKEEIAALAIKIYNNPEYISKYYFYKFMGTKPKYSYSGKDVYYCTSLKKFFKAFDAGVCLKKDSKLDRLNKLHDYLTNVDKLNTVPFRDFGTATILSKYCSHLGIKHKMMAVLSRSQGSWSDLVSPYEITWGVHIPENDIFITEYDARSNIYSKSGLHANMEVLLIDPVNPAGTVSTIKYPEESYTDNNSEFTASFDLLSKDEYEYSGKLRGTFKRNQIYTINDYIEDQFSSERLRSKTRKFFGLVNMNEIYDFKSFDYNSFMEEVNRVDSCWSLYFKDYYKYQMSAYLADDYKFSDFEVDSSRVDNDGDFADSDTSTYGFNVYFRLNNLLSKTDSDSIMLLHLGRLISEQFSISNFEAGKRQGDLYNRNKRMISSKSDITIPEGFKPLNLEDFNVTIQNEFWTFKSEAKFENGRISISTLKIYNFHHLPKEKWADFVKMLQSAEAVFLRKAVLQKSAN